MMVLLVRRIEEFSLIQCIVKVCQFYRSDKRSIIPLREMQFFKVNKRLQKVGIRKLISLFHSFEAFYRQFLTIILAIRKCQRK